MLDKTLIKDKDEENQQGLYVPQMESDACGIGMIADLNALASHKIIDDGLTILERMEHRGACGCEENTGDGAGLLCQIPHLFFQKYAASLGKTLPEKGQYAVAFFYLPKETELRAACLETIVKCIHDFQYEILMERHVPVDNSMIGQSAKAAEPDMLQLIVVPDKKYQRRQFEERLYLLRTIITRTIVKKYQEIKEFFYITSFSALTIVYKGQLTATQLRQYYPDLCDPDFTSAIAMVHSRFSTNTVPKWKLAQPFRCIAHNGEINTVQGNVNWWKAREPQLESPVFSNDELQSIYPVCSVNKSDSANFDSVLEFLIRNGKSLPHALMMMIPEAWHQDDEAPQYKKDFYAYHEYIMEAWDGPASICFTDGVVLGATLDRNGLRPSKYLLTKDNRLIIASEAGLLSIPQEDILYKENLAPGQILIADLDDKKIIGDAILKEIVCKNRDYEAWHRDYVLHLENTNHDYTIRDYESPLMQRQIAAGFTKEDEDVVLNAMASTGKEAISSMGTDIPLAILSHHAQHLSHYFKQLFAQVTNPPIDPIRERAYMSLESYIGGAGHVLDINENNEKVIKLKSPVLSIKSFNAIIDPSYHNIYIDFIDACFDVSDSLQSVVRSLCEAALDKVNNGTKLLVIDNTAISEIRCAIPSLLITGAIHHFLIDNGVRRSVSLIVCASDAIEAHHFATLVGYGADAIFASMAYESIAALNLKNGVSDHEKYYYNFTKAINESLLKIMSKLGISTLLSYKGAQSFEALGIHKEVIDLCFKGTVSRIGGMTFEDLQKETLHKHRLAFNPQIDHLIDQGRYQWKKQGEYHLFNPVSVHLLQYATKTNDYKVFKQYTQAVNEQDKHNCTIRSLFEFTNHQSIPLEEVEPVEQILKRFATGAMSFGSISHEAHTTLALAMNQIGGKSNSGEGGEDAARYKPLADGSSMRSAIKQVASGRFGVTIEYLVNADELQIKMAQGAKPGEGGQLPGHKVDATIARIRHSTQGVGLISPPPHHDIYSIEDLAQLIFDLKNANSDARISVKLVSKAGVGIIASGVAKAHADHILIAGHDGGTGASPLSSIMHAGIPWEIGLSETHQTLVRNGLRDRVTLQADGQIRSGKDLAVATLLGAEEWGIATAALVVSGCILMRKCHLNTCPVGIATQDESLRQKYNGKVEYLVNYFTFLAQELREIMASLGYRTINEMVGQTQHLSCMHNDRHWKYRNLDLSTILFKQQSPYPITQYKSIAQNHGIDTVLDHQLIKFSELAIEDKIEINSIFSVNSTDRSVGTMLSSVIAKKYGAQGLHSGSIKFRFKGSAGQSFGAFGVKGLEFLLEGEANDYFGKGLSGATLIVVPDRTALFNPAKNIIIGNVALFGATSGNTYIKGRAGERFCVRNSGANAVVEGVGNNACEYMTGGRVIIIGKIGRNFAAGMSGGIAYIWDKDKKCKSEYDNGEVQVLDADNNDLLYIREELRNHFKYTGSLLALSILQAWEQNTAYFKKVISKEYKIILDKREQYPTTMANTTSITSLKMAQ
jgi:glutamate synthase (NADPH) large chain